MIAHKLYDTFKVVPVDLLPPDVTGVEIKITQQVKRTLNED